MSPVVVPMTDRCMAKDYSHQRRGAHKAAPGLEDGQPIYSCVWCGKTLTGTQHRSAV